MILVYEPQCIGFEHTEINAALLIFLTKAKPNATLAFFGDTEHLSCVKSSMVALGFSDCAKRIDWRPISVPSRKTSLIYRSLIELYRIFSISSVFNRKCAIDACIFLSATSATLLGVRVIQHIIATPTYLVLHGILESILNKPNGLIKYLIWFKHYLPVNERANVRYITTAGFIKMNLIKQIPSLHGRVFELDFPYIFEEVRSQASQVKPAQVDDQNLPITITSAGVGSINKGTHDFFNVAKSLCQLPATSVQFVYAGRLADGELKNNIPACVRAIVDEDMLTPAKYQEVLLRTDYLVFFYPADSYKFGVSGVFLDAIKYEIPIIGIDNDFFKFCTDTIGKVGWLCNDANEIEKRIKEIVANPPQQDLTEIKANYKRFKQQHTTAALSDRLAKILNYAC